MRQSSQVIWDNDMCHYKNEAEGYTHTHTRESHVKTEPKNGVTEPQAKEH